MLKIAFYDTKPYDIPPFEKHGKEHGVDFSFFETKLNETTAQLANGHDGVCIFVNDKVNAAVIDKLYELGIRFIALRCAGYNNVDIQHSFGKIHIFNVPAYSPEAVAEHAMALLLTSVRRIHKAYMRTRDFNFSLNGLTGFNLNGKTVGVVGTGKIGCAFISICKGFGMKVLAYDKYPNASLDVTYTDFDSLLKESDIISLHCPLTEETKHFINSGSIAKMKDGAIIVNTSRGALIDTEALINGIKNHKIGAACLDVYEEESNVFYHDFSGHIVEDDLLARLISMPNVIVTSHQGFLTDEALNNIAETTVSNIVSFTEKGTSENELCYRCGKIETCKQSKIKCCF